MKRLMLLFSLLLCTGCGPSGDPMGSVSGTVKLDGQPLANALVTFMPADGGASSTGLTDASGKYELSFLDRKGAVLGKHKVAVTTINTGAAPASTQMSSDDPAYGKQGAASDYAAAAPVEKIPARYNAQTELVKEVTAGGNTIDLELTSS